MKKQKRKGESEPICRLLWLLVENLIPFHCVQNSSFNLFLAPFFDSPPSVDSLIYAANQMYSEYQQYFKNYFRRHLSLRVSVSCHHWKPLCKQDTYMMMAAHYIDDNFRLCEVPLCFFSFNSTGASLPSMMVRNTVMDSLGGRLSLVTTSYSFSRDCLDVLLFPADGTKFPCLPCVPSFLRKLFQTLLRSAASTLCVEFGKPDPSDSTSTMVYNTCAPIAQKLRGLKLKLDPATVEEDPRKSHFGVLVARTDSYAFLESAIVYQHQIDTLDEKEWQYLGFAVASHKVFLSFLDLFNLLPYPNAHVVLKWLMIFVVKLRRLAKTMKKRLPEVSDLVEKAAADLTGLHSQYESTFEVVLAAYLHPSTKCYLQETQIAKIHQYVESESKQIDKVDISWSSDACLENLDELVMNQFHCFGNANECYKYETSGVSVTSGKSYLTKECGPQVLQLWKQNQSEFPDLSKLASKVLAVPVSTDRSYSGFKALFSAFLASFDSATRDMVDVQALFVLHRLSLTYDVNRFDPKSDSNIEDFRLQDVDFEASNDEMEETILHTER